MAALTVRKLVGVDGTGHTMESTHSLTQAPLDRSISTNIPPKYGDYQTLFR